MSRHRRAGRLQAIDLNRAHLGENHMSVSTDFTEWLTEARSFFERLAHLGGEFDTLTVDVAPPLTTAGFDALQKSVSVELPSQYRDIVTSSTSRATLRYVWEPPVELKPLLRDLFGQDYLYGGGTLFDCAGLVQQINDCREFATDSWLSDDEF